MRRFQGRIHTDRSKWARSIWLKRNPPGSSSMRASCLRAVRGDGAALLLHRLVIDADPEPASDWINLSRGRERMSPDDILEQSDFPDATLDLTRDPVGRLVIAMWIVSPADKKGSRSNFPHAVSNNADRALGLFAFTRNKTIGETRGKASPPVSAQAPRPLVLPPPRAEMLNRSGG